MGTVMVFAIASAFPLAVLGQEETELSPVSYDTSAGYARTLFTFDVPPKIDARVENSVLVLTFEQPLQIDLLEAREQLNDYIALARQDGGGRTLRFALKRDFRLHTSAADTRFAVDLLPPNFSGEPPDLERQLTEEEIAALEAEEEPPDPEPVVIRPLDVRIGRQQTFSRITFDWPERVPYTANLEAGIVTVDFERPADPDIVELRVDPPRFVSNAEKTIEDGHLKVEIKIQPDAGMRHFREGPAVVIDILEPKPILMGGDAGAVLEEERAELSQSPTPSPEADPIVQDPIDLTSEPEIGGGAGDDPEDMAEVAGEEAKPDEAPMPEAPEALEAVKHSETDERPQDVQTVEEVEQSEDAHGDDHDEDHAEDPADDHADAQTVPAEDELESNVTAADAVDTVDTALASSMSDQADDPASADDHLNEDSHEADGHGNASDEAVPVSEDHAENHQTDGMHFEAKEVDAGLELVFGWSHSVPAAVFERGDYVWLVFDDYENAFALDGLDSDFRNYITEVNSELIDGARVIRLKLASSYLVTAQPLDGEWIITLGDAILAPPEPLELRRQTGRRGQPVLLAALETVGAVHWLTDPDVGDDLAVVTATKPATALITEQYFVDFAALRAAQGLVIQAISDEVYVRLTEDGVEIGTEAGLALSESSGVPQWAERTPLGAPVEPAFVDFDGWGADEGKSFVSAEHALHKNVTRPATDDPDFGPLGGRAALARFYLANEMGVEALGLLTLIERSDDGAIIDPAFLALRGIAHYMARRYNESADDLLSPSLDSDPNAGLWRGLVLAKLGRFAEARRAFEQGFPVLQRYPARWQAAFHVAAARTALGLNDLAKVDFHLTSLPEDGIPPELAIEAELIRGQMLEVYGRDGEALQHFQRVSNMGPRPLATRAGFAQASLLYKTGEIPAEGAIDRLERLRYQWRGDDLELDVLHRLGQIYVDEGDYRHGLEIMRQAVEGYPDNPLTEDIAGSMMQVFRSLFLDEGDEQFPPIQALALYYDYRDLTPIGRDGDDMIRKLADRLVAFDLLEQAAELLDHQVKNRLDGVARSQVATRLALIYLMDKQPDMALQTIRSTRQTRLPQNLNRLRRLLESRALMELGRYGHALELIASFSGDDVDQLRADIHWKAQDWQQAAKTLEDALGDRWQSDEPLDADSRGQVMRTAVSLALAEDDQGLMRLRQKFGHLMDSSSDAEGFEIVTQSIDKRGVEFRQLASRIAATNTLETFMEDFRDDLSDVALEDAPIN